MSISLILIVLSIGGVLGYVAVCFIFSGLLIHSHRQPIVRAPDEYGMDYEDIEFKSTDGLTLKGWFIPGKSDKIVILTHPFPFNRHGFLVKNQGLVTRLKTDVDLLKTARALNGAEYSVLMFDFRNHGESENGITGIGLNEYQDILGAMNYIKSHPDLNSKQIGFVSFCMGANSTIIAMSRAQEQFKDVKCLVAVQPVSSLVFFRCYVKNVYTPLGLVLLPLVNKMCQWRGGYSFKEMSPLPYCKDITVPTLYIQAKTDPWTELSDVQGFYEATPEPRELWMLEEKMGRFDAYNYVGENPEKIIKFLKKYL